MSEQNALYDAIVNGDAQSSADLTKQALDGGQEPLEIVNQSLIPAMDEVGRRFEEEEFFIPELLIAARAMKQSMALIQPLLAERGVEPAGRVVIGTVKGDLHDIGKNLVSSMLEGGGFEVTDLGVDVPPEKFIAAINEHNANLLCLSTLLTTTMPSLKTTIDALDSSGVRNKVKVLVGGAPVTQRYADEVQADGYGENARSAVEVARKLIA